MVDRARHDVNLNPTLTAVSNTDGETPVSLYADPITHTLLGGSSSGGFQPVTNYDTIDVQQTSPTVETYVYTLLGSTVRTVVVTYTDDSKADIDTVVWS